LGRASGREKTVLEHPQGGGSILEMRVGGRCDCDGPGVWRADTDLCTNDYNLTPPLAAAEERGGGRDCGAGACGDGGEVGEEDPRAAGHVTHPHAAQRGQRVHDHKLPNANGHGVERHDAVPDHPPPLRGDAEGKAAVGKVARRGYKRRDRGEIARAASAAVEAVASLRALGGGRGGRTDSAALEKVQTTGSFKICAGSVSDGG
jgi:hypothetical protein